MKDLNIFILFSWLSIKYFHLIKKKDGLTHTTDLYACIIDLFAQAENIINKMLMKPDKILWASILVAIEFMDTLNWRSVQQKDYLIRKAMGDKGMVKKPGLSWIEM